MGKRGRPRHPDILTPREWDVLGLLREGLSNPEIADRLGVSRETIKTHVSDILGKLELSSREEAAVWRREEHRPWWAGAFAPLLGKGSLARLVGAAVLVAVATGGGLLVWGLTRTSDTEEPYTGTVVAPDELVWQQEYRNATFRSVPSATCGDRVTAESYGVPRALRLEETSMAPPGPAFLGLEAEPYAYHDDDVNVGKDMIVAPEGWELSTRAGNVSPMVSVNRFATSEVFLRRLDQPDALFRYSSGYCDEEGSPAATPDPGLPGGGGPYTLPNDTPQIIEHVQGDYLSLSDALDSSASVAASDVSRDDVVVAELGTRADLTLLDDVEWGLAADQQDDVMWFLLARLQYGPTRPGQRYGFVAAIDATGGQGGASACCYRLVAPNGTDPLPP